MNTQDPWVAASHRILISAWEIALRLDSDPLPRPPTFPPRPTRDMPDWLRKLKGKDTIKTAKNAGKVAVALAEKALAPIPGAQAVFGSLAFIIDEVEVSTIPI